ncbi:MAG: putative group intron reverse transcriptase/maturase [Lacrimispora sp.]|nr:putative group intron reverse transcriptase/maturase [Lacrimispora sp.]
MEYLDNKISRYSMQNGKCAVTGQYLTADVTHCHHILPKSMGGTDQFDNLVILYDWIHQLVHATDERTIKRYLNNLQLTEKQVEKLNKYREKCNLTKISLSKE